MIALARTYRPRRFADLLVQDHVAAALRGAVAQGRVGHGYLLTGPRGVGKTTAARILAMALNCEQRDPAHPTGEPCGTCASCERIWAGSANLDVVEIDAASNRGVDDARDLRERAMYAASQAGHHKVYIVDEAHMLTREAWNALLKILEEPPPGVVFVFATTEPQKIANTAAPVLSRLQRFDFRRIGAAAIRDRLRQVLAAEHLSADDDALTLIARHADGGMRDALSVLDQCLSFGGGAITAERVREVLGLVSDEVYGTVLALAADHDPAGVFPLVDRLLDRGADLTDFMGGLADAMRALLVVQLGGVPEGLTEGLREAIERVRDRLAPEDCVRMLRLLGDTEAAIRRSANPRLAVETLLLRWTMMDRTVDLEAVLEGRTDAPARQRTEARSVSPSEPPSIPTSEPPGAPASERPGGPLSLDALRAFWPEVVDFGRADSRFLGEALAAATVESVMPPVVRLRLSPEHAVLAGALDRGRGLVEGFLSRRFGTAVALAVTVAQVEPADRPRRRSQDELQAERLQGLRGTDPALDAAVDELDLEIVEERPPER